LTRPLAALTALLALGIAGSARAGTAGCWVDQGVIVVSAEVAGIAGDYILDTGAPNTLLDETRAQGAGFTARAFAAPIRLAGRIRPSAPVLVADLDPRAWSLPTPIAGVIGADILAGQVLDIDWSPCRVGLWPAGRAPARPGTVVDMPVVQGLPTAQAAASDGSRAALGRYVLSTALDRAVRLSNAVGGVEGGPGGDAVMSYGAARPRLRAASFGGLLWEWPRSGLAAAGDLPDGASGMLGPEMLAAWNLRFDFARNRLTLSPRTP